MNDQPNPNENQDALPPQQQILELQQEIESLKARLLSEAAKAQAARKAANQSEARATELEGALARARDEVAKATRKISATRRENEELTRQLNQARTGKAKALRNCRQARRAASELAHELASVKRKASQLSKRLEHVINEIAERDQQLVALKTASGSQLVSQPLVRKWLVSKRSRRNLSEKVVQTGNGPLSEGEVRATLAALGRKAVPPAERFSDLMIVGRDGWLVDDLEAQIRVRGKDGIRVYSQEMLMAALATNDDPLKSASRSTLMQFADGHPALTHLIESGFEWPEMSWRSFRDLEKVKTSKFEKQSPINKLGYVVGKTRGLGDQHRRTLLAKAFKGELPTVGNSLYMKSWGGPGSRIRLRRMASHIVQLSGFQGAKDTLAVAVQHWSDDLDWMRDHLYEHWMRFRWPKIGAE